MVQWLQVKWWVTSGLLALLLCCIEPVLAARDPLAITLPDLPVPPDSQWSWVAPIMSMNGMAMNIREFRYTGAKEDVIAFYKQYWRRNGNPFIAEERVGSEITLGYTADGFHQSVQIGQAQGALIGRLVVSVEPGKIVPDFATRFPLPVGSRVIRKIEALDGGVRSETLTLESAGSVGSNTSYLLNSLRQRGWHRVLPGDNLGGSSQKEVLHFQRNHEMMQVVVTLNKSIRKTVINVHWVK